MSKRERMYKQIMLWAQARYVACREARNARKEQYIAITDHALLRYLERVEGIDIDSIRNKLLAVKLGQNTVRDGKYTLSNVIAVVKNKTIITVYLAGIRSGAK